MLKQTGITDDIANEYVTFVHGDLGGSERLLSAQLFRSIESTPLAQFKGVVDVPGLFHTVMASADAVFRLHVLPGDARRDETAPSVFKYIKLLLPKPVEHNKFKSSSPGPSFRRAHDTFTNIMNGLLLECWLREAALWNPSCTTLSSFASELKKVGNAAEAWRVIEKISLDIAKKYVAGPDFYETRSQPDENRDCIQENWQLYLAHTLIHTDLYHSIKLQDVGRVVYAVFHLLFIFAASKKNKYASHMTRVLHNLAYVFPDPLREAFLTSWTINPSGKAGGGRGVDWLVELFNLYLKVVHSGASSNFGLEQIIKVSTLIKLYKVAFQNFVLSYHLVGRTTKHGAPDMTETLDRLRRVMRADGILDHQPGRSSKYEVPDAMAVGQHMFMTGRAGGLEEEHETETIHIDFDDFELE
ncbi:hypothetical protein AURDEDRAFT_77436 [Auricularia subglabra TFB-10046 SS5]|uniref:DUF6589 domain-containing protein n=1 Tax=Auricularia subglabra (strain TFB-10046 / SS5) TaxID=717982 RepID=J0WKI7_AURST|nr:hypothetical protein AURDEDRAFT_77436 [Auricularia subglabra TFB-10046 SS5]